MLLTVPEVADILRLSVSAVYRMLANGALPIIRLGTGQGRIRVDQQDLETFVASCREQREVTPQRRPKQPPIQLQHLKTPSSKPP